MINNRKLNSQEKDLFNELVQKGLDLDIARLIGIRLLCDGNLMIKDNLKKDDKEKLV